MSLIRRHAAALCLAVAALPAAAQSDWRTQNDASRHATRMNELWRQELRSSAGIIAGAQADMAEQTASYYRRRRTELDARYAQFQKAVAEEEGRRSRTAVATTTVTVTVPPEQVLARMEAAASAGDAATARALGDAYRAGVGAARQNDAQALRWYRQAADLGDAGAATNAGAMLMNGDGVPRDEAAGFRYTLKGAQGGDEIAIGNLGWLYEQGLGTAKNETEAARWYARGAELGNPRAIGGYGRFLLSGKGGLPKDPARAIGTLRRAADAGDVGGAMFAGMTLASGAEGVPARPAEAVRYYEQAARVFPDLNGDLAVLYAQKPFGMQDWAKARAYAEKGAAVQDARSMYLLATAHLEGYAGPKNPAEGRRLLEGCAAQDDAECTYSLALAHWWGIGGPQNIAKGNEMMEKARRFGLPKASFDLGAMYHQGNGVPRDLAKAFALWKEAAEGGHRMAQNNVTYMLYAGEGTAKDLVAARAWAKKSADQGDGDGLGNYGDFLVRGIGGPRDLAGLALLEKAAGMNVAGAATALGKIYRDGDGVPRDPAKAKQWFAKAQQLGDASASQESQKAPAHPAGWVTAADGKPRHWRAVVSQDGLEVGYALTLGAEGDGLRALGNADDTRTGYVDRNGQWVIEPQFIDALVFTQGRAVVKDPQGQWFVIDRRGRKVAEAPEWTRDIKQLSMSDTPGLYYVNNAKDEELLVRGNGELVARVGSDQALTVEAASIVAYQKNAGPDGAVVTQILSPDGRVLQEGAFPVGPDTTRLNAFGRVRQSGVVHDRAVRYDLASKKYGYVDARGRWVIPPQFVDARAFYDPSRTVVYTAWDAQRGLGEIAIIDRQGRLQAELKNVVCAAAGERGHVFLIEQPGGPATKTGALYRLDGTRVRDLPTWEGTDVCRSRTEWLSDSAFIVQGQPVVLKGPKAVPRLGWGIDWNEILWYERDTGRIGVTWRNQVAVPGSKAAWQASRPAP